MNFYCIQSRPISIYCVYTFCLIFFLFNKIYIWCVKHKNWLTFFVCIVHYFFLHFSHIFFSFILYESYMVILFAKYFFSFIFFGIYFLIFNIAFTLVVFWFNVCVKVRMCVWVLIANNILVSLAIFNNAKKNIIFFLIKGRITRYAKYIYRFIATS